MSMERGNTVQVEGNEIYITHPEKVIWPAKNITKINYLQKLIILAPYLLTYCRNRYLTTIRFPDGVEGKSFYQKNAPEPMPSFVRTVKKEEIEYIDLDSISTLLWLGNLGALEFHPSFEYIGTETPAEWVLDIDPSVEEEPRIMEAVSLIGDVLGGLGIESVPKTSGATGVQIYVPIEPKYSFKQLRSVGKFVGTYLSEKYPDLFTIARLKKDRGMRIYIDYIQHWPGKSLSAPYTPRGRTHATVSTPLTWEEVREGCDPKAFNLDTIERRLEDKGDLIAKVPPQNLDRILSALS